jgi:hypothetical protein
MSPLRPERGERWGMRVAGGTEHAAIQQVSLPGPSMATIDSAQPRLAVAQVE